MYAQLGSFVFENVAGFQSFSRERSVRATENTKITGKSSVQISGQNLDTVAIEARLHVGFNQGDPVDQVETLVGFMNEGQILPLVNGIGQYYGNFLIRKIGEAHEILRIDGKVISCKVTFDLLEHVDPSPETTEKRSLIKKGFATDPLKVIPVKVTRVGTTTGYLASSEAKLSTIDAGASVANVRAAVDQPSKKESLFQMAKAKAQASAASIASVIERINQAASLAAKAPDLLAAAQTMKDNADLMIQRIEEGDLTNALIQADAFSVASVAVADASIPLDLSLILRQ